MVHITCSINQLIFFIVIIIQVYINIHSTFCGNFLLSKYDFQQMQSWCHSRHGFSSENPRLKCLLVLQFTACGRLCMVSSFEVVDNIVYLSEYFLGLEITGARYHSKYQINNNICFLCSCYDSCNEYVHIHCFLLLLNYFLGNDSQKQDY